MIVMVTGHRPDKLDGYGVVDGPIERGVRAALRNLLLEWMPNVVAITGMALGVDQWFVDEAHKLGVEVDAYVPFNGQERKWPQKAQAEYWRLRNLARFVTVVCEEPSIEAFHKRNRRIVDYADKHIAVWNGDEGGGTAACVRYMRQRGLKPIVIDPDQFRPGHPLEEKT